MNTKIQAEILRNCLELGLVSSSEVISWADSLVEQSFQPDIALIEVSMAGNLHSNDVADLLRNVPGETNPNRIYQGIFSHMRATLIDKPESETRIVRALFQLATAGEAPDKAAESEMFWFYDALDLAKAGYGGDVTEIRNSIVVIQLNIMLI